MRIRHVLPFGLLSLIACVQAQEPATITIRKGDTTAVALKSLGGAEGPAATKTLQNDLEISGLFAIVEPGRASFTITGEASGGSLKGKVTDGRGASVLEKTYRGSARRAAHEFADDIVETLTGQPGIASTKIAFVATRSGRKEIYTADYDGGNIQQLTKENNISVSPSLSPDGSKLAYTGYSSGYADIYLVDLNSGSRQRIIKFPGTNSGASFSPDGGRLAFSASRDGNPELYVSSANGSGARRLTRTRGVESSPTWGPDGREIIFSSDDRGGPQLFRISSGGGSPSLISTGHSYNTEPSWSPDGNSLAFNVREGGFQIAIKSLRGGSTRIIASGEDPVWGANSRHVIYSTGSSLILQDTVNGRKFPIVSGLGKISEPTWSR